MNLSDLLETSPETLAENQHDELSLFVISKLEEIIKLVKVKAYDDLQDKLVHSPAGDCMGCENDFIDFAWGSEVGPTDIGECITLLQSLSKIGKE